jgi:hypothetical protein
MARTTIAFFVVRRLSSTDPFVNRLPKARTKYHLKVFKSTEMAALLSFSVGGSIIHYPSLAPCTVLLYPQTVQPLSKGIVSILSILTAIFVLLHSLKRVSLFLVPIVLCFRPGAL